MEKEMQPKVIKPSDVEASKGPNIGTNRARQPDEPPIGKDREPNTSGNATNTLWKPKNLQEINDTISSPRADHLGGARRGPPDKTGRTQRR